MKLNWNTLLMLIAITAGLSSCRSNRNPKLMVKLVVDDTQDRLGNNGLPARRLASFPDFTRPDFTIN